MARLYKLILSVLLILAPIYVFAAWESGKNHTYTFSAITGGGSGALDSLGGVSIGALDRAIVQTGVTFYFYEVLDSGSTAVESSPYRIVPDDLLAGGAGITGTSTWALAAISGDTIYAKTFLVDNFDGDQIDDDSIDDDSIDFTDVTLSDLTDDVGYATNTELTNHTTTLTGVSGEATQAALTSHSGVSTTSGASILWTSDGALNELFDEWANWTTAFGWGDHGAAGYLSGDTNAGSPTGTWDFTGGTIDFNIGDVTGLLSGDTEAGVPTGTWDFTGGTIDFTATDMEDDLEAVLDIDDLQSGVSNVFDKTGDAALIAGFYDNTDTQLTQEEVEDFAGGMDDGTETRIAVTYQDAAGNIDYVVDDMDDMAEITAHTTTLTGVSGEVLESEFPISGVSLDFTSTGGVTLSGVSAIVINLPIFNPDDVQSQVSEVILPYQVDPGKFPNGIILDSIRTQQFGATAYAVVIEEWTGGNPSHDNDIETMTIAAGTFFELVSGTNIDHRIIEAGNWIALDLPTTETDQLPVKIKGRIR